VRHDDREHLLAGRQQRVVLTRVAFGHGNPVAVDELAEALWPRERGRSWEGALRGIISKVRVFLGHLGGDEARVDSVGHGYRLACAPPVMVDLWSAQTELVTAETCNDRGRHDRAARAARQAVELLGAPLLKGVEGDWIDTHRRRLAMQRIRALRALARAESVLGHHDVAVDAAIGAIEADALDECSHRVLMLAHQAAGNRGGALQAYQNCRRCLATMLGVAPCPDTEQVYIDLLGVEPAST
jgi:DNA-binding SARP family transcriptional activator